MHSKLRCKLNVLLLLQNLHKQTSLKMTVAADAAAATVVANKYRFRVKYKHFFSDQHEKKRHRFALCNSQSTDGFSSKFHLLRWLIINMQPTRK